MDYSAPWLIKIMLPLVCENFYCLQIMFINKAWYTAIWDYIIQEHCIGPFNQCADLSLRRQFLANYLYKFTIEHTVGTSGITYLPNGVFHGYTYSENRVHLMLYGRPVQITH